jgi:tetratricopeptide (TPR) repeat protein
MTIGLLLLTLVFGAAAAAPAARTTFDDAVVAFEQGDYPAAVKILEGLLRRKEEARVRTLLGWSVYRMGDTGRARVELERALVLGPRDANVGYAHEGLGWIAYREGDYDRAQTAFSEALRVSPGYHNALDGLGWTYLARRDFVRAQAHFEAALARVPDDEDARRGLGFVAYRRGDWPAAVRIFRDVLKANEGDTVTRSALAWTHYYAREYGEARRIFDDVERREPTWADPYAGRGWIAERQGRADEAKAQFRIAIARGAAYVATPEMRTLLSGRPQWKDLWHELAWSLYHQRSFTQAESEFRALLERNRQDADGLRGLGYTLYSLKRYREAIPVLQQALGTGTALPPVQERVEIPGVAGLHAVVTDTASTLAWSHYHAGDLQPALKLFREVTARQADWHDAWSGLGWTLLKLGDRAEAETAFRRSLQTRPGYPDATQGLIALGRRPS